MKTRTALLILLIILTMITAQYTLAAGTAQENEGLTLTDAVIQSTTATPPPASDESDSDHDDEATMTDSADHAIATSEPGQIFQVTIATYLMDTAGFHAMDERLNQEGTIEASDAGTINRVNGVLAATAWPEDLQAQVDALRETLSQYAEALANDDVEAAKPLATQTHELQHDLSHGIENWLSGMSSSGEHDTVFSLVLMVSVAVLVQTSKPVVAGAATAPSGQLFEKIVKADDLSIHFQVLPNQVGQNLFLVHLYHEDDSPIGEVQLVRLLFNYQETQLGQAQADLEARGGNIFGLEGAFLNQAGRWDLSIYVRRRGMDDILTDISLDVPPAGSPATDASPWQNPIPTWTGWLLNP